MTEQSPGMSFWEQRKRDNPTNGQTLANPEKRIIKETQLLTEEQRVQIALTYLPANDRDTWVNAAFAIKNTFGEPGFKIWDDWGKSAPNYRSASAKEVWRSAKTLGKTVASLYWLAKQNGFNPRQYQSNNQAPQVTNESLKARRDKELREQQNRHIKAAQLANTILHGLPIAQNDHPYLVRKQVESSAVREVPAKKLAVLIGYTPQQDGEPLTGRCLVAPVRDAHGKISTLEFIDETGRKTALRGGKKQGCAVQLREIDPRKPFLIVEGVATGCSMQMANANINVVAALSDTNLKNVALNIRETYPHTKIMIGADLGAQGMAGEAAKAVVGHVLLPSFTPEEMTQGNKDFNDMQVLGYNLHSLFYQAFEKKFGRPDQNNRAEGAVTFTPDSADSGHLINPNSRRTTMTTQVEQPAGLDASVEKTERKAPGNYLYPLMDIPKEVRDVAELQFGKGTDINAPRANGDYKGEVYDAEKYLLQEVGRKNVVIHKKEDLEKAGNLAKWDKSVNGFDLHIDYDGNKAKAYNFDRQKNDLQRAVWSLAKSMEELKMGEAFPKALEQAKERSFERLDELRQKQHAERKQREEREKQQREVQKNNSPEQKR